MVNLLQPTPDDICDPHAVRPVPGFIVRMDLLRHYEDTMTIEQWAHFSGPAFTGFDTDRTMLRISAMNLMLPFISNPQIDYKDSVSKQNGICEQFTICLVNPPFKGTVDAESIHDNLKAITNTKKTELLFLALFLRMLKRRTMSCIVPTASCLVPPPPTKPSVGAGGASSAASRYLHALRRIQTLRRRFHCRFGVYQNRRRRYRPGVVL